MISDLYMVEVLTNLKTLATVLIGLLIPVVIVCLYCCADDELEISLRSALCLLFGIIVLITCDIILPSEKVLRQAYHVEESKK